MARALMRITVTATQLSSLKALRLHLQRLYGPAPQHPDWAEQLVSHFLDGPGLTSASAPSPLPPPAMLASPSLPGGRIGVLFRVDGGLGVPWPSLETALAAHFSDDVFIGPQASPMATYAYASVARDAWARVSAGRSTWRLSLGSGMEATVSDRRGDGTPYVAPLIAASHQSFLQRAQLLPAKRHRSPPPSSSDLPSPRRPRLPPQSSPRPLPPSTALPDPLPQWTPPPRLHLPSFRSSPQALVTRRARGRRGPGQL